MVTRTQFVTLLKSVPSLPPVLIESWFDALALRFAHVAPPPDELTLDFRRILATCALVSFALKSSGEEERGRNYSGPTHSEDVGLQEDVGGRRWMVCLHAVPSLSLSLSLSLSRERDSLSRERDLSVQSFFNFSMLQYLTGCACYSQTGWSSI